MSHEQFKPEVIIFYNKTKSVVDVVVKLISLHYVAIVSCRWPLTILFTLLNIFEMNGNIIYFENTGEKLSRRNILRNFALELARRQIKRENSLSTNIIKNANKETIEYSTIRNMPS